MPLSKPEDIEDGPEPPEPSDPEESDSEPMVSSEFMGLAPVTEAIEGIEQNIMQLYEESDGNEAEIEALRERVDGIRSDLNAMSEWVNVNSARTGDTGMMCPECGETTLNNNGRNSAKCETCGAER